MIYSTIFLALKLRWVAPTVTLFGCAPIYCVVHCAAKIISLPFGTRVSSYLEDVIYAGYQSLTTLCFDLMSGVQVSNIGSRVCPCRYMFAVGNPLWGSRAT